MTQTASQPTIDMAAILARMAEREAAAAKLVPANKACLFAILASAGITLVTVIFDGCGDSGQIEDIASFRGDEPADLPTGTVEILAVSHNTGQPVANVFSVSEAIEEMAYDLLGQKHCGWENNDGAYGEFSFHVAEGRIKLDYNERFTASEQHGHEW
tara:strand:- start:4053 stop:4523 length:471 start_codon:yes stop_codon:yes gene_type:complete